jgi:hypothetical protein
MSSAELPRTVLPIGDRGYRGAFTYDAKDPDTSFRPIVPLRPPAGAPNVLIVLLMISPMARAGVEPPAASCCVPSAFHSASNAVRPVIPS